MVVAVRRTGQWWVAKWALQFDETIPISPAGVEIEGKIPALENDGVDYSRVVQSRPPGVHSFVMGAAASNLNRIILHADMDAFFAAVEQRDDPSLRGKPLVVGGSRKRGVVSTASYEARKFGLKSAMPMVEALRRCPDVIVKPPDFARYKAVSDQIQEVFHHYSPLVEPLSLDEAFLDMTGAEGLFGPPEEMGRRIKRDVYEVTLGLTISVGTANCKYVAKVASDHQKPDGLTVVPPDGVRGFLWPQGIEKLWGVGKKTQEKLRKNGLFTIRDIAHTSPSALKKLLGSQGPLLYELANGIDAREVIPERDPKSIGNEITLETDIRGKAAIIDHLRPLSDKVARRLRIKERFAGGVRLKLKTNDFRLLTRQTMLCRPSQSAPELFETAVMLLDKLDVNRSFRLVGIAGFALTEYATPVQGELFSTRTPNRQLALEKTLDAVMCKFGDQAVKRGSDV